MVDGWELLRARLLVGSSEFFGETHERLLAFHVARGARDPEWAAMRGAAAALKLSEGCTQAEAAAEIGVSERLVRSDFALIVRMWRPGDPDDLEAAA